MEGKSIDPDHSRTEISTSSETEPHTSHCQTHTSTESTTDSKVQSAGSTQTESSKSKESTVSETGQPPRRKDPRIFKIIVIGDSNVGKTCLTYRFCEGKFPSKVEATIGVDFREKTVEIGDSALKLQLWDTAGQERFRKSMVPHYYRNVHAVVYVYDVTKSYCKHKFGTVDWTSDGSIWSEKGSLDPMSTFDSLRDWLNEYSRYSLDENVPRLLVGNKCDLTELLQVTTNEAQCFADRYQMPLFETSAKDDDKTDHVESIFITLAHKLKESKPMMGSRYSVSEGVKPSRSIPAIQYTTIGQEKSDNCGC